MFGRRLDHGVLHSFVKSLIDELKLNVLLGVDLVEGESWAVASKDEFSPPAPPFFLSAF